MLLVAIFLPFLSVYISCDIPGEPPPLSYDIVGNISTEIQCPEFEKIANANIFIQKLSATRKVATITCDQGYDIEGNNNIYCVDGQWELYTLPECIKRCLPPPYIKDGAFEIEGEKDELGYYPKGTVVSYTCIPGYKIFPASSNLRVCEKGIWTGSVATCIPIVIAGCVTPKPIDNGYFVQEKTDGMPGYNTLGQRIHYYCKTGYILVGARLQQCLDDGLWSPINQPICELKEGKFYLFSL